MAGLTFENYQVGKMVYEKNIFFDFENNEIDLEPIFNVEINKTNEEAVVHIDFKVGSNKEEEYPFLIEVGINGLFVYNDEEAEGIEFEEFLKTNAIAMLFPYLRQIVSNLSSQSNEFPTFILPVMNVSRYVEENGRITINED